MRKHQHTSATPFTLILAACAALVASGCSGKGGIQKVTVEGTVTYKGERVTAVMIRVVGVGGEFAAAQVREDGTFTLTDVPVGEIKVGFSPTPQSSGSSGAKSAGPAPKKAPPVLPAKYSDPETSGLKYPITGATRDLKIELN